MEDCTYPGCIGIRSRIQVQDIQPINEQSRALYEQFVNYNDDNAVEISSEVSEVQVPDIQPSNEQFVNYNDENTVEI
jgi:hypothetical protein